MSAQPAPRLVPRSLEGKLAIVTGASRGIGLAISQNLAEKGANLVLNYTSQSSAQATSDLSASLTKEHGVQCLVVQADMGTTTGPPQLVEAVKAHFSSPENPKFQIDILINNAGVSHNTALEGVTVEDYDFQYRINVLGPLLLTQAVQPYLPHDRTGRIVNLSSISSSMGIEKQTIYGGTKAALEAMTRTWANELGERGTVNAVNPGPVKTDMWTNTTPEFKKKASKFIQLSPGMRIRPELDDADLVADAENAGGRPGYVDEVAGVVGMLCTHDARFCTGQVICANGGLRLSA